MKKRRGEVVLSKARTLVGPGLTLPVDDSSGKGTLSFTRRTHLKWFNEKERFPLTE